MKKIAFIAAVFLLLSTLVGVCAQETESTEVAMLSPGLQNLASHCAVRVSAMAGNDVLIAKDDFLRSLNKADMGEMKILSLPDTSKGALTLSGSAVKVGDIIGGENLSRLNFTPAGSYITDACFTFSDTMTGCEYTCEMYFLSKANNAPQSRIQSVGSYVSTYKNISVFSSLPGYDPDGNAIEFIIVNYPDKGTVVLDSASGRYEYIPGSGYTGDDSFTYVITDEYGAFSLSREVSITVESVSASEVFADMSSSYALVEAISLTRDGIMSGSTVGGSLMFKPDAEVTRAEFTAMLMESIGAEGKANVLRTQFYDDGDIPDGYKSAVAAAYELGYVQGSVKDGKLCFEPNKIITRAECAKIIDRVLSIENQSFIPVIAGSEECPEDALAAVNALCGVYVLPTDESGVNAQLNLTREYAAKLLFNVKSFITLPSAS